MCWLKQDLFILFNHCHNNLLKSAIWNKKWNLQQRSLNQTLTVNSARESNEKQVRQVQHMHVQLKGGIVRSVRSSKRNHAMLLVRQGHFLVFTQTMWQCHNLWLTTVTHDHYFSVKATERSWQNLRNQQTNAIILSSVPTSPDVWENLWRWGSVFHSASSLFSC